ncbi:MAG: DUF177 domain-containing protein [Candidatus Omnitrophica bacterium]|nr:DUF177 domain-containing protein [Candidatus Omnitrophota bacterium]
MIKVFLKNISAQGYELQKRIELKDIDFEDQSCKCVSPWEVSAQLERSNGAVLANVEVDGAYEFVCARCLEKIKSQRHDNFKLCFTVSPTTEFIELGDDIRQEMIMMLSSVVLCKQDCRGLCPHCGVNLNNEKCMCHKKE